MTDGAFQQNANAISTLLLTVFILVLAIIMVWQRYRVASVRTKSPPPLGGGGTAGVSASPWRKNPFSWKTLAAGFLTLTAAGILFYLYGTVLIVILAVFTFVGWDVWKNGGKSVGIFVWTARLFLLFALICLFVFGVQGAKDAWSDLQEKANDARKKGYLLDLLPFNGSETEAGVTRTENVGLIFAPVGEWSSPLVYPTEKCAHWWVDNDLEEDDVVTRFTDRETGEVITGDSTGHDVKSRSWKSRLDRPVRVSYQLTPRRADGSCSGL